MTRFVACCTLEGAHRTELVVEAGGFEEAALVFADTWSGAEEACKIMVIDHQTGERRCFAIDVESGAAEAC